MFRNNPCHLSISTRPAVDIYVRGISVLAFPAAFCYQVYFVRFSFAKLHKRAQSLRATQYQAMRVVRDQALLEARMPGTPW